VASSSDLTLLDFCHVKTCSSYHQTVCYWNFWPLYWDTWPLLPVKQH